MLVGVDIYTQLDMLICQKHDGDIRHSRLRRGVFGILSLHAFEIFVGCSVRFIFLIFKPTFSIHVYTNPQVPSTHFQSYGDALPILIS